MDEEYVMDVVDILIFKARAVQGYPIAASDWYNQIATACSSAL